MAGSGELSNELRLELATRFKRQGIEAYRRGATGEARTALLKAARKLLELAADSPEVLRDQRRAEANRLREMARKIAPSERPAASASTSGGEATTGDGEDPPTGDEWRIEGATGVSMDDVIGLEDAKAMVRRRIVYPFSHPEAGKRFERTSGGGVLLYGPPGTGKTMLARAMAGEVDAVFLAARSSDLMTKWVGESEQNLRSLFESARRSGRAVIFLDEVDAVLPARTGEAHVSNRLTQEFLVQMDGLDSNTEGILVVGATNRPWDMDPAALRPGRFGELIYVGLPTRDDRQAMLVEMLGAVPVDEGLDLSEIAARTDRFSGADLAGVVNRCKDAAFEREVVTSVPQCITPDDFDAVLSTARPSVSEVTLAEFQRFGSTESVGESS